MEDWKKFIHECGIKPGWENNLHYDNILNIFGIDNPVLINQILNTEITKNDCEKETMQEGPVRWLSKALCTFKVKA